MRTMALVAVVFLAGFAGVASAQSRPYVVLDENGNGSWTWPGVGSGLLQATVGEDPGDPDEQDTLVYSGFPFTFDIGDLILHDEGGVSDVLRFSRYAGVIAFYSSNADGADSLADVGLPWQPNFYGGIPVEADEQGVEGGLR